MSERGAVKAWVLAFVLSAGLGLGAFIGIGCLVGANTCPGSSPPKQTTTDGATLFLANCSLCHGERGAGGRAPSLVHPPLSSLPVGELVTRINNGKRLAGMPKFEGKLTPRQIRAVAEYVVFLRAAS